MHQQTISIDSQHAKFLSKRDVILGESLNQQWRNCSLDRVTPKPDSVKPPNTNGWRIGKVSLVFGLMEKLIGAKLLKDSVRAGHANVSSRYVGCFGRIEHLHSAYPLNRSPHGFQMAGVGHSGFKSSLIFACGLRKLACRVIHKSSCSPMNGRA